jgi:hypothetical protein
MLKHKHLAAHKGHAVDKTLKLLWEPTQFELINMKTAKLPGQSSSGRPADRGMNLRTILGALTGAVLATPLALDRRRW